MSLTELYGNSFWTFVLPVLEDLHKNREGASNWTVISKAIEKLGICAKELHSRKETDAFFEVFKLRQSIHAPKLAFTLPCDNKGI